MASCEKCWNDAYTRSRIDTSKGQADHYRDLIEERAANPCTPEEQAGNDADVCEKCGRKTIHQYAKTCMNCGYKQIKLRK